VRSARCSASAGASLCAGSPSGTPSSASSRRPSRPTPSRAPFELILRSARDRDGLTIIAIGPLTNLAAALVADPGLAGRLGRVAVIGGAFEVAGNVTPTAEFNFFMDPEAAQIVLEAAWSPCSWGSTCATGRI
jgi:inosine-uridine nucleoside N-ribohydrolase